jgi:hypothetical protein
MASAVEAHRAQGQFRRLKSTLNKPVCLKFRFDMRRPTVTKRVGQYFEPLTTSVKEKDIT